MLRTILLLAAATSLLSIGCLPSTKVHKNPGDHDRGIRYYRPKPYLLLKPLKNTEGELVPGYVSIEMKMLPDFSEDYSIHISSGLGTNQTEITLVDGWRLDSLNIDLDSKFSENVNALGDLGKQLKLTSNDDEDPSKKRRIPVQAKDVPLGYYEAVVSKDRNRVKRLYGFRYVGFMPYSPCPVESCGVDVQPCYHNDVYGLVFENNAMVFKRLDLAATNYSEERIRTFAEKEEVRIIGGDDDSGGDSGSDNGTGDSVDREGGTLIE